MCSTAGVSGAWTFLTTRRKYIRYGYIVNHRTAERIGSGSTFQYASIHRLTRCTRLALQRRANIVTPLFTGA